MKAAVVSQYARCLEAGEESGRGEEELSQEKSGKQPTQHFIIKSPIPL